MGDIRIYFFAVARTVLSRASLTSRQSLHHAVETPMIKVNLAKTLPYVVSLVTVLSLTAPAMAAGGVLKGGVDKTDSLDRAPATTLNRNEVGSEQTPTADEAV